MEPFEFEDMNKTKSKLSVSIFGPSGSGKTSAALKLAKGIQEQLYPGESLKDIGLFVDTERRSSTKAVGRIVGGETIEPMELYAFEPPYDIYKLAQLLEYAVHVGKKIAIVDSYTSFWSGMDGILDRAAELDVQLGSQKKAYGAWSEKEIIQKKNVLKNLMTSTGLHIIFCFRAKTEYVMEQNARGKMVPKAVGLQEDMQKDVRYEFDSVISLDKETHAAEVVKDRIGYLEIRNTSSNPEGPLTIEDGKILAKIASEGYSLEEVAEMKRQTYINFILDEKSHKATKVSLLEQKLGKELSKELLEKQSYENLTKFVKYIKS